MTTNLDAHLRDAYIFAGNDEHRAEDQRIARALVVHGAVRSLYHAAKEFGRASDIEAMAPLVDAAEAMRIQIVTEAEAAAAVAANHPRPDWFPWDEKPPINIDFGLPTEPDVLGVWAWFPGDLLSDDDGATGWDLHRENRWTGNIGAGGITYAPAHASQQDLHDRAAAVFRTDRLELHAAVHAIKPTGHDWTRLPAFLVTRPTLPPAEGRDSTDTPTVGPDIEPGGPEQ